MSQRPVPFGKYLLLERISVGGMAEVFKARTFGVQGFSRLVAIKRILPHLAEDEQFVDMFIGEAKMAVQLTHNNIAQIFDLGRIEHDHYIAMEYVSGRDLLSLHNHFRKTGNRLPVPLVAYIGARIAEGLDYAHNKKGPDGAPMKIVHRDISPQNVLISYDGAVKLIDFGIAKGALQGREQTQAGVLKGKFGYMSPELISGLPVDHRSDIFALGTVLHELLTSERLFLGESDFATLEQIKNCELDPPSAKNPAVPPALDAILMRALAKSPDDRFSRAGEMAEAMDHFIQDEGLHHPIKALGDWMKTNFQAEITKEAERNEAWMGMDMYPEEEEEPTSLWDTPGMDPEPAPVPEQRTWLAPDEAPAPHLPLVGTQIGEDPQALPNAPTPVPTAPPEIFPTPAPALISAGRPSVSTHQHRRLIALAVLLLTIVLGGVIAGWLLLEPAPPPGEAGVVLYIEPESGLTIYVDNTPAGESSPFIRKGWKPGAYAIRVERPGYTPWKRRFILKAGEFAEERVTLQPIAGLPGKVRFVTEPRDAQVLIDGRPLRVDERYGYVALDSGRPSTVEIRKTGYLPYREQITPEPGAKQTRSFRLEPAGR